jgi:hypothetical protein
VTALILCACAGLDQPGLETYQEIRNAVTVTTDSDTGIVRASSEPAAKVEVDIRDIGSAGIDESGLMGGPVNSQRARQTAYFVAERTPTGETQVLVIWRRQHPLAEENLQDKPWTEQPNPSRVGLIGQAWREIPRELVEFRYECPGSKLNCTRYAADQYRLSPEDVRALLVEKQDKIRISFNDRKDADWHLDADELIVVLDAIGFPR